MKIKWQDRFLTIAGMAFCILLFPMVVDVYNSHTVLLLSLITSFSTMILLYVMAYTFWTLDLKIGAISECATATMWLLLFIFGLY